MRINKWVCKILWTPSIAVVDLRVLQRSLFILRDCAHVSESLKNLHSLVTFGLFVISLKFPCEPAAAKHEDDLDESHDQKAGSFSVHIYSVSPLAQIVISRPKFVSVLIFRIEVICRNKITYIIFADVPVVLHGLVASVLHNGQDEVEVYTYERGKATEVAKHCTSCHVLSRNKNIKY